MNIIKMKVLEGGTIHAPTFLRKLKALGVYAYKFDDKHPGRLALGSDESENPDFLVSIDHEDYEGNDVNADLSGTHITKKQATEIVKILNEGDKTLQIELNFVG